MVARGGNRTTDRGFQSVPEKRLKSLTIQNCIERIMEYSVQLRLDKQLIYVDTVRQYSSCQPSRRQVYAARAIGLSCAGVETLCSASVAAMTNAARPAPQAAAEAACSPNAICDEAGEVFAL